MRELILKNKDLFLLFAKLHRVASKIYAQHYGGVSINLYDCYKKVNDDGMFAWVREAKSFLSAMEVTELLTQTEVSDLIDEFDEVFGEELRKLYPWVIAEFEKELLEN